MKRFIASLWPRLAVALVVVVYLETLRALSGAPLSPSGTLLCWGFVQSIVLVAWWVGRGTARLDRWVFSWRFVASFLALIALALAYVLTLDPAAAWVTSLVFYALLVVASSLFYGWPWRTRLMGWVLVAAVGGAVPPIVGQVESSFAEEEFFVALQIVALGVFTGLLVVSHFWLLRRHVRLAQRENGPAQDRVGLSVPRWIVVSAALVLALIGVGWTVRAYQHSFYPARGPTFAGVSRDAPFICGQATPDPGAIDGAQVFARLLAQTADNPMAATAEVGMLALASGEERWAEAFRQALLDDIGEAKYTGPAHSVKSTQYLAARLVYYYARVRAAFPDLFSQQDQDTVQAWLTAVNRRALTVEWVDWLYALAFAFKPEGPYENQENGAGLLALLEAQQLVDAGLSVRNRSYLERMQRGWFERFRNTDDVYIYQPEWIVNALFQQAFWQADVGLSDRVLQNRALAFEWLLLQALPDGAPLAYNHPSRPSLAPVAYLGAHLLDDPRYVWWSDRLLEWAERAQTPLYALPGTEHELALVGESPALGSCLVYGDSGLPTQQGPLAPDKVVFRDGWAPDSQYLLLNLRFSGWHRYKATNTVTLVYQGGPLVAGQETGRSFSWLPTGRSLFRDKRIPRENLNGFLVPRTGLSAVLYGITGIGGPWAQDAPHYASVEQFETLGLVDVSRTAIDGWRGWRHERVIYFLHSGPILVLDEAAASSARGSGAIVWHLMGDGRRDGDSLWLGKGENARLVWPADTWSSVELTNTPGVDDEGAQTRALYRSRHAERLDLATTFLTGDWVDSQVQVNTLPSPTADRVLGYRINVSGSGKALDLLHNVSSERLEADGLAADGQGVLVWRGEAKESVVCALDGQPVQVVWATRPVEVRTLEGKRLPPGRSWRWDEGTFVLDGHQSAMCVNVR